MALRRSSWSDRWFRYSSGAARTLEQAEIDDTAGLRKVDDAAALLTALTPDSWMVVTSGIRLLVTSDLSTPVYRPRSSSLTPMTSKTVNLTTSIISVPRNASDLQDILDYARITLPSEHLPLLQGLAPRRHLGANTFHRAGASTDPVG